MTKTRIARTEPPPKTPKAAGAPASFQRSRAEDSVSGAQVSGARISRRAADRLRAGHLWVYASDIESVELPAGDPPALLPVADSRGLLLGTALYSPNSQIALRLVSREAIDEAAWLELLEARLRAAIARRRPLLDERNDACRLCFSEADELPGLVADKYGDLVILQLLAKGLDSAAVRETCVRVLRDELTPEAILERPDPRVRELEGLAAPSAEPLFVSDAAEQQVAERGQAEKGSFDEEPSGAKAPMDSVGFMRGLKPPPPSESSSPPGAKARTHDSALSARLKSCPDTEQRSSTEQHSDTEQRSDIKQRSSTKQLSSLASQAFSSRFRLNGLVFEYDANAGQKTGAFLDQRANYAAAAEWARKLGAGRWAGGGQDGGGRALDVCCYQGGFALHLAEVCGRVTGIDASRASLEVAERNLEANRSRLIAQVEWVEGDAFEILRGWSDAGESFDAIVLDPPAFAKSHRAVEGALRGYKELNLRALKMMRAGGLLMTCSCSHHVGWADLEGAVASAAADAHRRVRLLERRGAAPDHPVVLNLPETEYLKCLVLEVE